MLLDVEHLMNRYRDALKEITKAKSTSHHVQHLIEIAEEALDTNVEPTTADQYNVGDDVEYKWVSPRDPGDENDKKLEER